MVLQKCKILVRAIIKVQNSKILMPRKWGGGGVKLHFSLAHLFVLQGLTNTNAPLVLEGFNPTPFKFTTTRVFQHSYGQLDILGDSLLKVNYR